MSAAACGRGGNFSMSVSEALSRVRSDLGRIERAPESAAGRRARNDLPVAKANLAKMRAVLAEHRTECETCAPLAISK